MTGVIDQSHHARSIIRIWDEVRNMFKNNIAVSGRLTLKQEAGLRVIEWRGVELIKDQFQVKTMLMDATLPPLPILQIFHPQVKIIGDVSVAMPPSVRIRQFLGTPTTSNKIKTRSGIARRCAAIFSSVRSSWAERRRWSSVRKASNSI